MGVREKTGGGTGRKGGPAPGKEARPKPDGRAQAPAPERRCSSRTFRYGYLVTT